MVAGYLESNDADFLDVSGCSPCLYGLNIRGAGHNTTLSFHDCIPRCANSYGERK